MQKTVGFLATMARINCNENEINPTTAAMELESDDQNTNEHNQSQSRRPSYIPTPLPPLPPPGGYAHGHPSHPIHDKGHRGVDSVRQIPNKSFYEYIGDDEEELDEWADDDDPGYVVLPLTDEEFLRFVEFAAAEQHEKQLAEAEMAALEAKRAPPPPPPPPPPPRTSSTAQKPKPNHVNKITELADHSTHSRSTNTPPLPEEAKISPSEESKQDKSKYATITAATPSEFPMKDRDAPSGFAESLGSFELKIIFKHFHTGFEDSKDFVAPRGSLIAGRYRVEETLGSAAFSTALQCSDLNSGGDAEEEPLNVCLKVIKNNKDFFDQSLDEIKLLHYINSSGDPDDHHVLHMYDFFYFKEHLFIVSELLRENLYEFGKFVRESGDAPYFTLRNLKKISIQMLEALHFVHKLGLIHCDVKPENIVIRSYSRCEVKLIDFGSSCFITDQHTTYIQSRSYRAPEVILGMDYDGRIDIWSLGCVIAEQLTGLVLFQNDSVQTMLARIQGILGPFPEKNLETARDTAKYMTPNNIVYERVRVEPDAPVDPDAPLEQLVDLNALADNFEDIDDEDDAARESRWQHLVAAAAEEAREMANRSSEEQFQYLVVYPKHTTLRHRLHTRNSLFLDFVGYLLTINHTDRPTAEEALRHPWLFSDDDLEEEMEQRQRDEDVKRAQLRGQSSSQ